MSKTLIVTHTDLDGVMSGLVAKYATANESDIRYADAGAAGIDAVLEDVLAGDDQYTQAIFLDNTPSAEMLAKFHNQTNLTPTPQQFMTTTFLIKTFGNQPLLTPRLLRIRLVRPLRLSWRLMTIKLHWQSYHSYQSWLS